MYNNLKRPLSISILIDLLQLGGVINLKEEGWKRKLQDAYCRLQTPLMIIFSCLHLYNTIRVWTRGEHDLFEISQYIYEDVGINNTCLQILFLKKNAKNLILLINFMENSFSHVNEKIFLQYHRFVKILYTIFIIIFILVTLSYFNEFFTTKRENLHLTIPFVEAEDLKSNKLAVIYYGYMIIIQFIYSWIYMNFIPFIILDLIGQYTILSNYIDKLGVPHYNEQKEEIFYTNIEKHQYVLALPKIVKIKIELKESCDDDDDDDNSSRDQHQNQQSSVLYEYEYSKQIIKFHQKLLLFQHKVSNRYIILYKILIVLIYRQ